VLIIYLKSPNMLLYILILQMTIFCQILYWFKHFIYIVYLEIKLYIIDGYLIAKSYKDQLNRFSQNLCAYYLIFITAFTIKRMSELKIVNRPI
jgi:hypothetical protein